MTPTKQNWAQRERAKNWVFVGEIVAVAATVIALIFTAFGLWEQVKINRVTSQEIKDSRIFREDTESPLADKTFEEIENAALARNWTLLTTPAPGNSGKKQAMEYLASKEQPLDGIDLSCETMGGVEKDEQGEAVCVRQPYLRSLDLSEATHGWEVSLIAANLSGADLLNADLSNADLWNANLSGADLWEADLSGTRLSGTNLSGAILWNVNLSDANLSGANLSDADLMDANLSDAELAYANLSGAILEYANLSDAELAYANLSDADLRDADLSGADLKDANLSGARLWNVNLSDADLYEARLSGANLSDANL